MKPQMTLLFLKRWTLLASTSLVVLALAACDVSQTKEAELPDVDVKGGQMPEFEVETADVEVEQKTAKIPYPDVDVDVKKKEAEVTYPDIDLEMPGEEEAREKAAEAQAEATEARAQAAEEKTVQN